MVNSKSLNHYLRGITVKADQCKHLLFERTLWRVETMLAKSKQADITLIYQSINASSLSERTMEQEYREETGNKTAERSFFTRRAEMKP